MLLLSISLMSLNQKSPRIVTIHVCLFAALYMVRVYRKKSNVQPAGGRQTQQASAPSVPAKCPRLNWTNALIMSHFICYIAAHSLLILTFSFFLQSLAYAHDPINNDKINSAPFCDQTLFFQIIDFHTVQQICDADPKLRLFSISTIGRGWNGGSPCNTGTNMWLSLKRECFKICSELGLPTQISNKT